MRRWRESNAAAGERRRPIAANHGTPRRRRAPSRRSANCASRSNVSSAWTWSSLQPRGRRPAQARLAHEQSPRRPAHHRAALRSHRDGRYSALYMLPAFGDAALATLGALEYYSSRMPGLGALLVVKRVVAGPGRGRRAREPSSIAAISLTACSRPARAARGIFESPPVAQGGDINVARAGIRAIEFACSSSRWCAAAVKRAWPNSTEPRSSVTNAGDRSGAAIARPRPTIPAPPSTPAYSTTTRKRCRGRPSIVPRRRIDEPRLRALQARRRAPRESPLGVQRAFRDAAPSGRRSPLVERSAATPIGASRETRRSRHRRCGGGG